jgi:hypothetical protein
MDRPTLDDPQWREKMAEYRRNLTLRDLPNELGHTGEVAFQQFTDPRMLKSPVMPLPAWLRLLSELTGRAAQSSVGVTKNKLNDE